MDRFNSRLDMVEGKISKPEDSSYKIIRISAEMWHTDEEYRKQGKQHKRLLIKMV